MTTLNDASKPDNVVSGCEGLPGSDFLLVGTLCCVALYCLMPCYVLLREMMCCIHEMFALA